MLYNHIPNLSVNAIFSADRKHRYLLEMSSKLPSRYITVCAVMQNPSYADKEVADKSVQFLEKLVFQKDYPQFRNVSKLIVVNQFSYIQTKDFIGGPDKFDINTDRHIKRSIKEADIILLAWGKSNIYHDRINSICAMLSKFSDKEIYVTKKHPSRGFYDDFIYKWSFH